MLRGMKIAFYVGLCGGYGAMEARQYDRLQKETEALCKERHERDTSAPLFEPVAPLLVVDTESLKRAM